nr:hypothetical protein [Tanacetum cinerariifolium]
VESTAKTKRPHPRSKTKNDRAPSASKSSCIKNKDVEVQEYHRNLLLSKNKKHMSSECNNVKLAIQNDKSEVVCVMCDNACTSNPQEPTSKWFLNFTSFLGRLSKFVYGTICFGNDHFAAILGYGDLSWRNILITRVYFIEGLGHNLFSAGNCTTNLYTTNLHEMASASPIFLIPHATSTKSWLWHQRLSYLDFDTNGVVERRNWALVEAARTIIRKNMETMNVTFDQLSTMAFEQRSSKPKL